MWLGHTVAAGGQEWCQAHWVLGCGRSGTGCWVLRAEPRGLGRPRIPTPRVWVGLAWHGTLSSGSGPALLMGGVGLPGLALPSCCTGTGSMAGQVLRAAAASAMVSQGHAHLGHKYVSLWDFEARMDEELSFWTGDLFHVARKEGSGGGPCGWMQWAGPWLKAMCPTTTQWRRRQWSLSRKCPSRPGHVPLPPGPCSPSI